MKGPSITNLARAMRGLSPMEIIEKVIILPDGRPYGAAMTAWQRADFEAMTARHPDGRPLYRLVYIERRRGESKTEDVGAGSTSHLITGPRGHRSYVVAAASDQAQLLIDSIEGFRDRSELVNATLKVNRFQVRNLHTGSELRVLSAEDRTAFGIRPYLVAFDELSLQPDDRLWKAMWSAIGKRHDAQMVVASMAGWDFSSVGWQIRELARTNPAYYFASRAGTEPAPWLSAEMMAEQEATLHPSDYARYWLCEWREVSGSWLSRESFDACVTGVEAIAGHPEFAYRGYVDVGILHDPTAICIAHNEGDARTPRVVVDTIRTLQGSRTAPVEMEAVEDLVVELTAQFGVKEWQFESPQAVASVQRLARRMPSVKVTAKYPTAVSMGNLYGTLYRLVTNKQIVLYDHQQLRREALSLAVKTSAGRMRVVESSAVHQDHVVAVGGCATLLLASARADYDGGRLAGAFGAANAGLSRHSRAPWLASGGGYAAPTQSDFEPAGRKQKRELFDRQPGGQGTGPTFTQPTAPSRWGADE